MPLEPEHKHTAKILFRFGDTNVSEMLRRKASFLEEKEERLKSFIHHQNDRLPDIEIGRTAVRLQVRIRRFKRLVTR